MNCLFCGAGVTPMVFADGHIEAWGCLNCGSRMTGYGKIEETGEMVVGYLRFARANDGRRIWVPYGKLFVCGEVSG